MPNMMSGEMDNDVNTLDSIWHFHFYINPKWNFHVMPTNPGGPTGLRSCEKCRSHCLHATIITHYICATHGLFGDLCGLLHGHLESLGPSRRRCGLGVLEIHETNGRNANGTSNDIGSCTCTTRGL